MTKTGRFLSRQKLDDVEIKNIIYCYAYKVSVLVIKSGMYPDFTSKVSSNTIYVIYGMLRKRLLEIGFYTSEGDYLNLWFENREHYKTFPTHEYEHAVLHELSYRRGVTKETYRYHVAEIIHWIDNPDLHPEVYFKDILQAIKLTGPLNEPVRDKDAWHDYSFIQSMQRHLDGLRQVSNPDKEAIAATEGLIRARIASARKRQRELRKQAGTPTRKKRTGKSQ